MKKGRVVLAVFVIVLMGVAWVSYTGSIAKNNEKYDAYIAEATQFMDGALYQKAIQSLGCALDIKETTNARSIWLEAYDLAYKDGVVTRKQYASALEKACSLEPKNAEHWETLISLYLEHSEYSSAYSYYNKSVNAGAKSEELLELKDQILYSYSTTSKTYTGVCYSSSGYNTVYDGKRWGVMDSNGEWLFECVYEFASPVGNDIDVLLSSSHGMRVVDRNGVVQAVLNLDVDAARGIGNDLLPVYTGGKWAFYSCLESKVTLQGFEDVTSFSDGIAAVKANGKWSLICSDGTTASDAVFDDVKYADSGEFAFQGIVIAASKGQYALYDTTGNPLNAFQCKDADVYLGGYIAFQDKTGKWGYVNKDGKIVVEPKYEQAKSFSNGLGAVCLNGSWDSDRCFKGSIRSV